MRRKRFDLFLSILAHINKDKIKIIDLGGTAGYWEQHVSYLQGLDKPVLIKIVNLFPNDEKSITIGAITLEFAVGDATNLVGIKNKEYDVVYSNSVLEHVGNLNKQLDMAREIYRIADYHFIQTPNRYFPIEAHVLLPYWQFWPLAFRGWLVSKKQIAWMGKRPNYISAKAASEQIRLLTIYEAKKMFPLSTIYKEKALFLTKSIILILKQE